MDGQDVIDLFEQIPKNIDSIQRTLVGRLMSAPLPERGYNKSSTLAEQRLTFLINLGLFDKAISLYQTLRTEDTTQKTHELGLIAGLLNKKIDLTCVEYYALRAEKAYSKWEKLETLCKKNTNKNKSTNREWDKNTLLPPALPEFDIVSFEHFQKADLAEKALLMADNDIQTRIPDDYFKDNYYGNVLELIFALKHQNNHSKAYKHALSLLHYYGLESDERFNYQFILPETLKTSAKAITDPTPEEDESGNKETKQQSLIKFLALESDYPAPLFDSLLDKTYINNLAPALNANSLFMISALKALDGNNINFLSNVHKTVLKNTSAPEPALPILYIMNPKEYKLAQLKPWYDQYCGETVEFGKRFCLNFHKIYKNIFNIDQKSYPEIQTYEKLFSLTKKSDYVMSYVGIDGVPNKKLKKFGMGAALYSIIKRRFYDNSPVLLELEPYAFFYNDTLDEKKQMYVIMKTLYALKRNEV